MSDEKYYIDEEVSWMSELKKNQIVVLIQNVDYIGVIDRNTK